ncbi:mast cell-expressed membrane protein 1 isoform X2 [Macaca nemestrina]|uniref:mast cell-expressed membrane protein 1 isoform X2 n=1 Tax=Macaca nemestrina TaxID=9545 RepID=UPI0039B9C0D6
MEVEEIYKHQEVKMQAPAFKDKKRGISAKNQGAHDPDYENITLAFRNQDHAKGGHSRPTSQGEQTRPTSQVPAQGRPPSDSTQVPRWLYRAILSLYILLALAFVLCIILSAFIMMKNAEMSKQLLGFKTELWNGEERQKEVWKSVQGNITTVRSKVEKLEMQLADIRNINMKVQKILELLQTKPQSPPQ